MRWIVTVCFCLLCALRPLSNWAAYASDSTAVTGFLTLKTGAGGYVTGLDIECDQGVGQCSPGRGTVTKVARTNAYGAYWFNPSAPNCGNAKATGCWQQIIIASALPVRDYSPGNQAIGAYELVIAPSNTQHFWMIWNGYVYSSTNQGATWTHCNRAQDGNADANNGSYSTTNRMIAVDPANEWSVVVTTPQMGVSYSNGLATACTGTWTTIASSSIPPLSRTSSDGNNYVVAYDPTTTKGGSTLGICVGSYGNGLYCTPAGPSGTWTKVTGSPTTFNELFIDPAGIYWIVDDTNTGCCGALNKYSGGLWSTVISNRGYIKGVTVDPANALHVLAIVQNGSSLYVSINTGRVFVHTRNNNSVVANDIPWLGYHLNQGSTPAPYAASILEFDPSASNLLYMASGVGVFATNPPLATAAVTWTSVSAAMEHLVSNSIINTPTGVTAAVFWDICAFTPGQTTYPATFGVTNKTDGNLQSGWAIDWASSDGNVLVALCQGVFDGSGTVTSGISFNGGGSWSAFPSQVSSGGGGNTGRYFGGCIAASTPTNILQVQANQPSGSPVWYTTNGASSAWLQPDSSLNTITTGWPANYYQREHACAADRVTPNKFYLYNFNYDGRGHDAIFASTNGGRTWSRKCSQCAGIAKNLAGNNPQIASQLISVPGEAENLFFTSGRNGDRSPSFSDPVYVSTNSGATWTTVPDVQSAWLIGFGESRAGSDGYPEFFCYCWVNNGSGYVGGVWEAENIDSARPIWTKLSGLYPNGSLDTPVAMDGDKSTQGTVYICFQGSACAYGVFNYLLKRDLNPASNDNNPAFLSDAALLAG